MSKCNTCPAVGTCRAEHPDWGFLCRNAARGYKSDLAMIRAYPPLPRPPQAVPAADVEPAIARTAAEKVASGADVAETLAILKRARECRFKTALGCGCRYGSCGRLGREVGPSDCIACLRAGEDRAEAAAAC